VFDLGRDRLPGQTPVWAEAAVVAKYAPARGYAAIHIWASEAGVDAYAIYPGTEFLAEKLAKSEIRPAKRVRRGLHKIVISHEKNLKETVSLAILTGYKGIVLIPPHSLFSTVYVIFIL
jgi:hypothetical protein